METKVLEETTYYRIESPRGVMSDIMTGNDVRYSQERGYFTLMFWTEQGDNWVTKRYKIGKIYKYTRKTTLTEEVLA
jgi:hypothetical protein